jgi:hypothetical protein
MKLNFQAKRPKRLSFQVVHIANFGLGSRLWQFKGATDASGESFDAPRPRDQPQAAKGAMRSYEGRLPSKGHLRERCSQAARSIL